MFTSPLPLFPLGLVLLPGATVPLHIFEPRYRAMLRDVSDSGSGLGIIAPPEGVHESALARAARRWPRTTLRVQPDVMRGRRRTVIIMPRLLAES